MPARRGELKYLIVTHSPEGEHLVRFVLRSDWPLADLRAALPTLLTDLPSVRVVMANLHPEHKAVLEGDTEVPLTAQMLLPVRAGDVTLLLGPKSFFQTNTVVAGALYRQAREWVDEADPHVVCDLYCGVGGFALHATGAGRTVVGVETSAEAVEAARAAAARGDAVGPASAGTVRFEVGDATTLTPSLPRTFVADPPRRGIGDLAGWLESSTASTVLYSSCNVDSLVRDLAAMPSLRAVQARLRHVPADAAHRGHGAARAPLRRSGATPVARRRPGDLGRGVDRADVADRTPENSSAETLTGASCRGTGWSGFRASTTAHRRPRTAAVPGALHHGDDGPRVELDDRRPRDRLGQRGHPRVVVRRLRGVDPEAGSGLLRRGPDRVGQGLEQLGARPRAGLPEPERRPARRSSRRGSRPAPRPRRRPGR